MSHFILSTTIANDDEWNSLFVLDWRCFQQIPEIAALTPSGLDYAARSANIQALKASSFSGPTERIYAVLKDPATSEFVAYVTARVYRGAHGIIDGPFGKEPSPLQLPQIADPEDRNFYEWYWNKERHERRSLEVLQAPHVYVQGLGTDPKWRRQGAGIRLMNWILDFVAREGLPRCALSASPETVESGFYSHLGFNACHKLQMRYESGRTGTEVVIMVKKLKAESRG
ncbi:MAG: hypothetical protein MMC23_002325 [Stictis urceolatum]|nr:hypothetical protein [Stictis urceolata]